MKRIVFLLIIFGMITGCVSTGPSNGDFLSTSSDDSIQVPVVDGSKSNEDFYELESFFNDAYDKLDEGNLPEAIKLFIKVMARVDAAGDASSEARELAKEAEIQLQKIETSLTLSAESSWIDENMIQISGTTMNLDLKPTVVLTYMSDFGRTVVANVPIRFQFVEGSGLITNIVNTDRFGQASCEIARFDNQSAENIIQASLVFKERDFVYHFQSLDKDFIFLPPDRRATILVLERFGDKINEDPAIFDRVFNSLKDVAFDFTLYNGFLNPEQFTRVYGGDVKAIEELSLVEGVSYLVVVLNDCYNVSQVEFNGKLRDIYISEAQATLRIIRALDGKILYQKVVTRDKASNLHGQGGNPDTAARNALQAATIDMENALKIELKKINEILTGDTP
ncbi:MAG: hypothetical protein JXR70_08175 [Spirochaetales bacterium]|nr:hypothetical protein [Spirochaetales bacterium]